MIDPVKLVSPVSVVTPVILTPVSVTLNLFVLLMNVFTSSAVSNEMYSFSVPEPLPIFVKEAFKIDVITV